MDDKQHAQLINEALSNLTKRIQEAHDAGLMMKVSVSEYLILNGRCLPEIKIKITRPVNL